REDSAETLGRVRELLFGEVARAQAEDVADVRARVAALDEALRGQLDALRAEFDERLERERDALRREFRAEVERVDAALDGHGRAKVERTDLRRLLNDLADRIGADPAAGAEDR
ncbi:MAG: hypothetical protein AAFP86_15790, partial [Planctomycetota bacterium]